MSCSQQVQFQLFEKLISANSFQSEWKNCMVTTYLWYKHKLICGKCCQKIFLEAIFLHLRKVFSKFPHKMTVIRWVICTGLTLFALVIHLNCKLLSTNQNQVNFSLYFINNGNRTEWSPVQSVIIHVKWFTKLDDCKVGVRFVNHEYDCRLNWTTRCPVTN